MREPDGAQLPLVESFGQELERAIARHRALRRRSRRRVISLVCAGGLLGASLLTPPGRAASGAVGDWLGIGEPGGPPSVEGPRPRVDAQVEPTGSTVVAAGRSPDGERYEFVLERFTKPANSAPRDEDFRQCLNVEWPSARAGRISPQFGCQAVFPPVTLGEAVVKVGGTMFDPSYTGHVQLAGLTRLDVRDVRILYKDESGARRQAPVGFQRVGGALRERAGADGSFGVFMGFLPPAWLGYGARYNPRSCPVEERALDPDAIRVIAYGREGDQLASKSVSNLNSWAVPPCGARGR
jgi:hypothetical protein